MEIPASGVRALTWLEVAGEFLADLRLDRRPRLAALPLTFLAGAAADFAWRGGGAGCATAAIGLLVAAALIASGLLRSRTAVAVAAVGGLLAALTALRQSPWVTATDLIVAAGALALATVPADLPRLPVTEAGARLFRAAGHVVLGPVGLLPELPGRPRLGLAAALARGLLLAAVPAAVLTWLLAAADPIFASFLNVDATARLQDGLAIATATWLALGLLRSAAARPVAAPPRPALTIGRTEALVVLAVLDTVFAAFAVAQVVAAAGGGAEAIRSAGMTYSDYARSGYFQLLWAAAATLITLPSLRALTSASGGAFGGFWVLTLALVEVIVVAAFGRLQLYESAYGFTMLRLYCQIFAAWLAFAFAALAFRPRAVSWGALVGSAAVLIVVALNVTNPEDWVARQNLALAPSIQRLDAAYLASLSDDAVPALAASGNTAVRARVCAAAEEGSDPRTWSVAAAQAAAAAHSARC